MQKIGEVYGFKENHTDSGQDRTGKKLNAGHFDAADKRRKMINNQNMYGKSEHTGKHKKIALLQREGSVCHAEQIETDNDNENCEPDLRLYSFSEEQAADRNKDDVKCGDKTGLSDGCVLDADLLQG